MRMTYSKLTDLTAVEVSKIYQERIAVFVVEQNCPYQDVDDEDYLATHVCLWSESGEVQAYSRIIQKKSHITFGRVIVSRKYRSQGYGKVLLTKILGKIEQDYPDQPVVISAQAYLERFYSSFGFVAISEVYLEDGIPHLDMRLEKITID